MDWSDLTVLDIAAPVPNSTVGGPFGSNLTSSLYVDAGVPVIRGQNMGGRYVGGEFAFVSQDTAEKLKENQAKPGDLIFTQRGTLGQVSIVPPEPYTKYIVSQSQMKLTPDSGKVNTMFLYYLFRSPQQLAYIEQNKIQTGVPHTNLGILRKTPVSIPDLLTQDRIASILSSIDDKIELNNQINETLESMAKAIFKEWFIDFGPVRANAESRKPFGMDDETAAFFPDSFEDSELGKIPKGWEVKTLGETCDLLMGQSPPGDTYNENGNGMVFYQGRAEFGSRYPSPRLFCSEPSRIVNAGTVLLSVRAPVGDLNISTEEQTCIGRGLAGILHKAGGTTFTYYLLQSLKDKFDMYNGEGTVFGSINKDTLFGLKIISPPELVMKTFLELVRPLDNLYFSNFIESRSLTQTRDLLLPKLISGELQLKEVTSD